MTNKQTIFYSKIGSNRGRSRIWIQGQRLAANGFNKGDSYSYHLIVGNEPIIKLIANDNGDRIVSGKVDRNSGKVTPIIDLCSGDITQFSKTFNRVKIVFTDGLITITPHHLDKNQNDRESRAQSDDIKTTGSLCAGGGVACSAIHQGLISAGVNTQVEFAVDRDLKYLEVADANNDIKLIVGGELEEVETLPVVDVLQVSLPCTGHSKAGKAKNNISIGEQHQSDATAIIGMLQLIKSCNPSVIISENVTEARTSASYELIRSYLTKLGYKISEFDLDQDDAGSLEKRTRYWFVATSANLPAFDPNNLEVFTRKHETISEIMESIPLDSNRYKDCNYLAEKEIADIKAGKGFRRQILDSSGSASNVGCIGRHYSKIRSTEPMVKHPANDKVRLFTPVEHARLKGIPEQFIAGLSDTIAHQILGQSILYNHGVSIGAAIGRWFDSIKLDEQLAY